MKGSENTSAATYMQTIFRVQSPYNYKDADGNLQMKTKCYVFDFAPDRSIKMVAETAKFATLTQKERSSAQATSREKDIQNMKDFLSFCPVISLEGGQMVKYEPRAPGLSRLNMFMLIVLYVMDSMTIRSMICVN